MLTRLNFNAIKRVFGGVTKEPKDWKEAHDHAMSEVKRLEDLVYRLQAVVKDYADSLNKKGALAITQATIDASVIGGDESAAGRFTKLGVGQAPPTSTEHSAYLGTGSGRQYVVADGGSSGAAGGPGFVLAYGGTLSQGLGGYSSLLGGAFDQRMTLYSAAFDMVIGHASNSYCVDFVNPADGAAAQTGTLTNAPSAGNPAYWLKIKIAGSARYIPCWS